MLRIAALNAAIDGRHVITAEQLDAEGKLVAYSVASAQYVLDRQARDPRADRIRRALDGADPAGLSRSNISALFSRNLPAATLDELLETLTASGEYEPFQQAIRGRPAQAGAVWLGPRDEGRRKKSSRAPRVSRPEEAVQRTGLSSYERRKHPRRSQRPDLRQLVAGHLTSRGFVRQYEESPARRVSRRKPGERPGPAQTCRPDLGDPTSFSFLRTAVRRRPDRDGLSPGDDQRSYMTGVVAY